MARMPVCIADAPISTPTGETIMSGAGAYPITLSGGSDPNYAFTLVSGTLTITQAMLTVTADNQSSTPTARPTRS